MRNREIKTLGTVIDQLVDTHNLRGRLDEQRVLGLWAAVVGRQIAGVTQPISIRLGVLSVEVKSSSWRQELTYKKESIIQQLNDHLESNVVKNIVFK